MYGFSDSVDGVHCCLWDAFFQWRKRKQSAVYVTKADGRKEKRKRREIVFMVQELSYGRAFERTSMSISIYICMYVCVFSEEVGIGCKQCLRM